MQEGFGGQEWGRNVVFRKGLGLGGIEVGTRVEVVGEGLLGGLVLFTAGEVDVELGLR